jgi:membrane fusion protein, multidrug efflux system
MSTSESDGVVAEPRPEERKPRWKIPLTIGVLCTLVVAVGAGLLLRAERGVNKVALDDNPKSVEVVAAKSTTFRPTRKYVGTLEPWLQARMGTQLASGFVDSVLVRPGAVVKRGDVLATIDCRNASAGNLAVVQQARALAERQKAASREASRLTELLDGGFASANEVEQKQAQSAANEAQMQALLAQASGKSLEVSDCVLRAPFDGEIAVRNVDPGSFVRPGASVVQVVDRSMVRLSADVPEVDFEGIPPKTPVRVHLLATGAHIEGAIARRAPGADFSTRTIHFEVDLPNGDRTIPVGTTAQIEVDVGTAVPVSEIPILAAKVRGSRATVFVADGGVVHKVVVDVVGERDGSLFVKTDLPAGAQVVTQGRSLLANNDRVAVKVAGTAGAKP